MTIPTQTYSEIDKQFKEAIKWLSEQAISIESNRLNAYYKSLEYWKDNYKTAPDFEVNEQVPAFLNSLYEVDSFIKIHQAFKGESKKELEAIFEKIKKGVKGPCNYSDETHNSNTARNFLFEVLVSAMAHKLDRNIKAILNAKNDAGIECCDYKVWVECKRITSFNKLEKNIKKAIKQLEKSFGNKGGTKNKGVVAIDITKLINRDNGILSSKDDKQLKIKIDRIMDDFISENKHIWQSAFQQSNKKIIGIIIRVSFMATSEKRKLFVHASQWGVHPRPEISSSNQALLESISEKMSTSN